MPVQQPSIPFWIDTLGGEVLSRRLGMDQAMVDVIARHADWWNNTPAPVERCRQVLDMLRQACARNGTSYEGIGKSLETQVMVAETPGRVRQLQDAIEALNPRRAFYSDWSAASQSYVIGTVDEVTAASRSTPAWA
jgi:alkanesulfonate monooxygenase SsuD/methylene tetrahydromethanopterin reductase-like flavin-dependent oxidoreductase (luciferase family)